MPEKVTHIVMHCSASPYATASLIREWHLARGWLDIGYHYVISNGRPESSDELDPTWDGLIELGRDLDKDGDVHEEVGAHALGYNYRSLGICLVGRPFSGKQYERAVGLVAGLVDRLEIDPGAVIGHNETAIEAKKPWRHSDPSKRRKRCPTLDMDVFRRDVARCLDQIRVARQYAAGVA